MGDGRRLRDGSIGLSVGLTLLATAVNAACAPGKVDVRGPWGKARFSVELADTPAARARGLMHRESLPTGAGMLFVYDRPRPVSFWMKNTLIPLDMIFAGADGVVRRIHENARPNDTTSIPGGPGVKAALEINGGLAGAIGIEPGSEMRHPAFGADAAWPCPADDEDQGP